MKNLPTNLNETSDDEESEEEDDVEEDLEEEEEEEEEEDNAVSDVSRDDDGVEDRDSYAEEEVETLSPTAAKPNLNTTLGSANKKLTSKKPVAEPKPAVVAAPTQKAPLEAAKPALSGMIVSKGNGSAAGDEEAAAKSRRVSTQLMVDAALRSLNERSGSSVIAIKKYIMSNYADLDEKRTLMLIKKYIRRSLGNGKLVQTKGVGVVGSFKLSTEATKKEALLKKMKEKKLKEQDKKQKVKEKAKSKAEAKPRKNAAPKSTAPVTNVNKELMSKKETKVKKADAPTAVTPPKPTVVTAAAKKQYQGTKGETTAKAKLPGKKASKVEPAKEEGKKPTAKTTKATASTTATTKKPPKSLARKSLDTQAKPPLRKSAKKTNVEFASAVASKVNAEIIKNKSEGIVASAAAGADVAPSAVKVTSNGNKKQKSSKK